MILTVGMKLDEFMVEIHHVLVEHGISRDIRTPAAREIAFRLWEFMFDEEPNLAEPCPHIVAIPQDMYDRGLQFKKQFDHKPIEVDANPGFDFLDHDVDPDIDDGDEPGL
jgi:hypothetical protein